MIRNLSSISTKNETLPIISGEAIATGLNIIITEPAQLTTCNNIVWIPTGTEIIFVNESKNIFKFPEGWEEVSPTGSSLLKASGTSYCIECTCSSTGNCKSWENTSSGHWGCTAMNSCTSCCGTKTLRAFDGEILNEEDYTIPDRDGILIDKAGGIQLMFNSRVFEHPDGNELVQGNPISMSDWKNLESPPAGLLQIPIVKDALERYARIFYHEETPEFMRNNTIAPCNEFKYVSIYLYGYTAMMAIPVTERVLPYMQVVANGADVTCECSHGSGSCTKSETANVISCTPSINCSGCKQCRDAVFGSAIPTCEE